MLSKKFQIGLLSLLVFCGATVADIKITPLDDKVRVEISGKLFTEYYFKDVPRPYCYPVIAPGDVPITRNWPMKTVPGEEQDHVHHRGLWFTHGSVNGIDFWSEQKSFGKQVHEKFLETKSGKVGIIRAQNKWVAPDGKVICRDERVLRVHDSENPRILDYDVTIKASEGDIVLGDTKEGTMAIRLAETMRVKPNEFNKGKPTGHILQDTGIRDGDTWGKRAAWTDYSGPVDGKTLGVAMFDHPSNPRHPTWWHVRDYGLFAANPFGTHDFEKKPPGEGNLTIAKGKSVTFRYRFVFHEGDSEKVNLPQLFKTFSAEK